MKKLGRFTESVEVLRRAVELSPDYLPSLLNLSYALINVDDYQAATSTLERVRQLAPNSVEAIRFLAQLYRMQSRHADAQAAYTHWSAADPHDPVPRFMLQAYAEDASVARCRTTLCAFTSTISPNRLMLS